MSLLLRRPMMLCLLGLCLALPGTAAGRDAKTPDARFRAGDSPGDYLGEKDLLRIDEGQAGRSFRFRFKDRENAARTREGLAEMETRSRRKSRGQDFDFVLSRDGRTMTVSIRKKGADRQAGDAQRAGTYTRLDCLEYKDGRLRLRRTGRPLPEGMAPLSPVAHSRLRFAAISPTAVKEHNLPLRPGLYLVAADGQVRFFEGYIPNAPQGGSPEYFGDMTDAVSLSPDKKVLAIGSFPALNGNWWFFSWPDSKPLAHPRRDALQSDTPALFWGGRRLVVVDVMDVGGGGRPCEYDPCGPVSVVAYDLLSGETTRLFPGTAQCDYRVTSVGNGTVTAARRCLLTAGAWAHFPEDVPLETVTAPLPSPETYPAVSAASCRKRVTTRSEMSSAGGCPFICPAMSSRTRATMASGPSGAHTRQARSKEAASRASP